MIETDIAVGSGLSVTCTRDELVAKLATVSRVVSSRGTVQVLSGVLLRPVPEGLELAATDMELSLRTTLPAKVDGDSSVVVPGKLLVDLARLLPADEVTIAYRPEEGVAQISSGSYSSKLNVFSAEDFPRLPSTESAPHAVATASLLETVDRVARSASKDESRPVLTGIQVRFEGTRLFMAATDSYRLSFKETELEQAGPDLEAIIPARALIELQRIAAGTETIAMGVNDNTVVFGTGDTWLTTRRIDGQFPDVGRLLPESFEAEVDLPARRASRRRPPCRRDGPPERAPAAALRRGRAHGVGAEPGRRRDERVAAGADTPESRSRSASMRSSSPTGSTPSVARRCG